MSVTYMQIILKDTLKALVGVDFTKYALSAIIYYVQWSRTGYVKNATIFFSKLFFIIKLPHAHLQYVCHKPARYKNGTQKDLWEVDCKKYELSAVIQYAQWRELAKLNAVNLSKIFFHH